MTHFKSRLCRDQAELVHKAFVKAFEECVQAVVESSEGKGMIYAAKVKTGAKKPDNYGCE